ncbi:MAG: glycosyltransferase family 4 protein [Calditrichia bacterium]
MKKEILYIDAINASTQYNFCLLNILNADGVKISFLTSKFAWESFPLPPNTKIFFFRCSTWLCEKFSLPRSARQILRALEYPLDLIRLARLAGRQHVGTVHFNWSRLPALDLVLIQYLKRRGTQVILTAHNFLPHDSGERHKRSFVKLYESADQIVVLTEFVRKEILAHTAIPEQQISVIPHPDFSEIVSAAGYSQDMLNAIQQENRILFFGAILPYKGLDVLIDAFAQVSPEYPQYRLCILGNAYGHFATYEKQIHETGVANKTDYNPDFISTEDLIREIKASKIGVLPYRRSSQSGVIPLVNTLGIPVIATAVGGIPEMVLEGENGYLVSEVNADKLAETLRTFLSSEEYQPSTEKVLNAGKKLFSREAIVLSLKQIYS